MATSKALSHSLKHLVRGVLGTVEDNGFSIAKCYHFFYLNKDVFSSFGWFELNGKKYFKILFVASVSRLSFLVREAQLWQVIQSTHSQIIFSILFC